jgi:hypothetical protein
MGPSSCRLVLLAVGCLCACGGARALPAAGDGPVPWDLYHKTDQILDFFKKVSLKVPSRVRCARRSITRMAVLSGLAVRPVIYTAIKWAGGDDPGSDIALADVSRPERVRLCAGMRRSQTLRAT